MRRFHQIFGWTIFLVFLLTGQYMSIYHNHLVGTPDGVRMLYRSRHIYILLAALLNIALGLYFSYAAERWRRVLQTVRLNRDRDHDPGTDSGILLRASLGAD